VGRRFGGKKHYVKLHNFGKGTKMIHVNKKRKEKKKKRKTISYIMEVI
jgi:hypothetical protein